MGYFLLTGYSSNPEDKSLLRQTLGQRLRLSDEKTAKKEEK